MKWICGGNNSSKPNNIPTTGGTNSVLIIGIGVLLVVWGILFIKKLKMVKRLFLSSLFVL